MAAGSGQHSVSLGTLWGLWGVRQVLSQTDYQQGQGQAVIFLGNGRKQAEPHPAAPLIEPGGEALEGAGEGRAVSPTPARLGLDR